MHNKNKGATSNQSSRVIENQQTGFIRFVIASCPTTLSETDPEWGDDYGDHLYDTDGVLMLSRTGGDVTFDVSDFIVNSDTSCTIVCTLENGDSNDNKSQYCYLANQISKDQGNFFYTYSSSAYTITFPRTSNSPIADNDYCEMDK